MSGSSAPISTLSKQNRIPVVIVDDEEGVRVSVRTILRRSDRFCCAAEFASGEAALEGLSRTEASLALMDVRMPGLNGVECIRRMKQTGTSVRVIVLSAFLDDQTLHDAANAGADGFLTKPIDPELLLNSLALCFSGGVPLAAELKHSLATVRAIRLGSEVEGDPQLSDEENRIMAELALGKSYDQIGKDFGISHALVAKKLHRIYTRYGMHNRVEALKLWAARRDHSR